MPRLPRARSGSWLRRGHRLAWSPARLLPTGRRKGRRPPRRQPAGPRPRPGAGLSPGPGVHQPPVPQLGLLRGARPRRGRAAPARRRDLGARRGARRAGPRPAATSSPPARKTPAEGRPGSPRRPPPGTGTVRLARARNGPDPIVEVGRPASSRSAHASWPGSADRRVHVQQDRQVRAEPPGRPPGEPGHLVHRQVPARRPGRPARSRRTGR